MSKETEQTADTPIIPGYRILGKLGTGGMATVYLANQESFDREVALKVMAPALAADANYGERFMREARIAARFSHPNIIAVYDVGVQDNHFYIGMEYHPGGDLKGRLKKGMTTKQAMTILRQMGAALDYAHNKGYIHRDVKPDNILFRDDGSAVLTDFGIARPASGDTQMTQLGMVVGTPKYMSPEQARGQELDSRSDIYSLGIVFYEMLVGRVPFDGKDSIDIGIKHVKEPVPPLPDNVKALQPILDRLLAKRAEERYSRGRELIADLDHLRLGALRGQHADPSGQVRAVAADRAIPMQPRQQPRVHDRLDDTIPPTSRAGKRKGSGLRILLLPLVLAAGGWVLYDSGSLTPLLEQLSDATSTGINPDLEKTEPGNEQTSNLTLGVVDSSARLAGESLGSALNSQMQPASLPMAGFAPNAAAQLSDIQPGALPETLPEEDFQTRIINEMLIEAETLMASGRLLTPEGSNALESYRGVLTLDPDNKTALAGLQAIASHSLGLADKALAAGSLEPADRHLQQAREISPELAGLEDSQQQLDEARTQQEVRVAKARADAKQARQQQEASQAPAPTPRVNRADAMLGQFKVKGLLRSAEYDMAEGRYTKPEENNALYKYRQVLQLNPGNADALRGLQALSRELEQDLDQAIQSGDKAQAMSILQELRLINPNNPRIQQATALITEPED